MGYKDFEIRSVSFGDKKYPGRLSELKKPPKKLYYRGDLGVLRGRTIGIVGSRRMSRYGAGVVDSFVSSLAEKTVTISGFMYGVDTEVHRRTVEYGGVTVGVFGCGLDVCYPPENGELYGQILESGGLVLSEYEPQAKPHLWKFPQRNRIVAALSKMGILVVEAGVKSGSLVTARLALEMGRDVYAVPGKIDSPISKGTNLWIKEGKAKMVVDAKDIVGNRKAGSRVQSKQDLGLVGLEKRIWEALEVEALSADEVAISVGSSVVEVGSALSVMAVKGLVSESGGKYYATIA